MKSTLNYLYASLILVLFSASLFAQGDVQSTIVHTATNQATIYAKSATTSYTQQIGNITLCFSIADQTLSSGTNPTDASITKTLIPNNVSFYTTGISNPYIANNRAYYVYNILPTTGTDVTTSWPANTDNAILTLTFPDETTFSTLRLDDLSNVSSTPTSGMSWYCQLNGGIGDVTNYSFPFYGTTGVVNTNGAPGEQYVPLQEIPTPVNFLSFNATKQDNSALLSWSITNESANTASYEIDRSINGKDFTAVTTIASKNNGYSNNNYSYTDDLTNISADVVYYKIKQADKNGQYVYTEVRSLRLAGNSSIINVFPNPVKDITTLNLNLAKDALVNIHVTDVAGKEINVSQLQGLKGFNQTSINMTNLSAGNYLLKVQIGNEFQTLPLIKVIK